MPGWLLEYTSNNCSSRACMFIPSMVYLIDCSFLKATNSKPLDLVSWSMMIYTKEQPKAIIFMIKKYKNLDSWFFVGWIGGLGPWVPGISPPSRGRCFLWPRWANLYVCVCVSCPSSPSTSFPLLPLVPVSIPLWLLVLEHHEFEVPQPPCVLINDDLHQKNN